MRPELLKLLHRNSDPNMDFGQFAINMGEWELIPIIINEEIIGSVAEKNGEVHMAIEPQFRKKQTGWRTILSLILQPLIGKYGNVTTRVKNSDTESHRFVQRLGFEAIQEINGITNYTMNNIKYGRKLCQ